MATTIDLSKIFKGTVKWYNVQMRYGFLLTDEGDMFFHYNDGRNMRQGIGGIEWCDPPQGKRFPDPKIGDKMVFVKSIGYDGRCKASPWTTETVFQWVQGQPKPEPPTIYRALRAMCSVGAEPTRWNVVWQGTIEELRRKHPLPTGSRSISSYDFLSYWSDPDNIFETHNKFQKTVDNQWIDCDDPQLYPES